MIVFLDVLELAIGVTFIWFFVTQICIPIISGRPLLSAFRKEVIKLEKEMTETNLKVDEKKMSDKIKDIKQKEGV